MAFEEIYWQEHLSNEVIRIKLLILITQNPKREAFESDKEYLHPSSGELLRFSVPIHHSVSVQLRGSVYYCRVALSVH
ncbi:hypothetical protein CR513_34392, partial [Mucuna pruriens]